MHFYKHLSVVVSLALLASCGGGGGSSDSSGSQPSTPAPVPDVIPDVVPDVIPEIVPETVVILNNAVVSETPTEFFALTNRVDFEESFDQAISFNEFFENVFNEVLLSDGVRETSYFHDTLNNLERESTVNTESGLTTSENTFNYIFDNDQIITREETREIFRDDGTVSFRSVNNTQWSDGIPLSFNLVSEAFLLSDPEDSTTVVNDFTYAINTLGQAVSLSLVEDGESTLVLESEFDTEIVGNTLTSNELLRTSFDSESNEVTRIERYSFDGEVFIGDNLVTVIDQSIRDGVFVSDTVNFYIHFGDFNQTFVVTFNSSEFIGGASGNDAETITSFSMSRYTYTSASTCGDYEEIATVAFNLLVPTCITNLTYSN